MLKDLVLRNRSYRRFKQEIPVSPDVLRELVDLARHAASGGNLQPLKYYISADPARNATIFPNLGWARYLADWKGPADGERPSAYIIILGDTSISSSFGCDHGIAAQTILLGATERGLGGCMIASIAKERLRAALEIPAQYEILLVLALGTPAETVHLEPLDPRGDVKYWRDPAGVHHVPKRHLDDILLP